MYDGIRASMYIGIDDTDSKNGMCTTYLAAVLVERLQDYGRLIGYPRLVRLNPNIRYKTRGNGAVAIQLEEKSGYAARIEDVVVSTVKEMAEFDAPDTNPGIVILNEIPEEVKKFSKRAVQDIVAIKEAIDLAGRYGKVHAFKNGRGVIGALAAVGAALEEDHTYELIAYRQKERCGTHRDIDERSVFEANEATYPLTWGTVDITNDTVVFSPGSPCPVLFGIRGDDVDAIQKAFEMIRSEPVERHIVFKTNQGTDAHLMDGKMASVKDERSYILKGVVGIPPHTIEGGHVIFSIAENGHEIDCAAYEPTKNFRDVVRELCVGDEVRVYGAVKGRTINLEKIEITSLGECFVRRNPVCRCGKRMKSIGRNQGYRCKKCGTHAVAPEYIRIDRELDLGLYEVPPSARRHISKPLIRMSGNVHPSV